jgi:hypothetical protein
MSSKSIRLLIAALAAASTLGAAAAVYGQAANVWDPSQLPETKGTVKQYTLTPRGDVDGLILNDGTEVKLPPHLSSQVVYAIRPGDAVTVRGLRARILPLVDAASVTNDATGASIVDNGPGPGRATAATALTGRIAAVLHGKRGEVNGALLDDGTILRLPPPEAERVQSVLQPGQMVTVRGVNLVTPLGTVMNISAIGTSPGQLTEFTSPLPGAPKAKGGPKGWPK